MYIPHVKYYIVMKQFFTLYIFLVCKQIFSKCTFVANPAFGRIYGILLFLLAALRFSCAFDIHNKRFDTKVLNFHALVFQTFKGKKLIEFLVYIYDRCFKSMHSMKFRWNNPLNNLWPIVMYSVNFFFQFYKQPFSSSYFFFF